MNTLVNTIDEEFDLICQTFLNKTAISDFAAQLTYRDVHYISQQCEQAIRRLVPADDSPVIVCVANQLRLYGLFIGIMKVGRPYYYIEPSEHLAIKLQLAKKVGATLVIGDKIQDYQAHHLDVDMILNHALDLDDTLRHKKDVSIPCCLVQTSATTQDVRVVAIRHSALRHHIKQFQNTLAIAPNDRIGLLSLPKFSASTAAVYGALLSGASFSPFSFMSNGLDALIEWIQREQLTILHTTPSLFRIIAQYASKAALSQVRAIKLGGETLYPSDFGLFKDKFSEHCLLINGLGMSEVGGNVTYYILSPYSTLPPDLDVIPVGQVLPGHQVRIVNEQKKVLPVGEMGEIVVSSPYIADGYWNAGIDENCNFKYEHSTSQEVDFYTNDIGYFLTDGSLIHTGRKNRLFKRRGLRVDLNQIESVLLRFNTIHNVAAYMVPIEAKTEVYSVGIQLVEKDSDSIEHILSLLRSILPEHMIPQRIHLVDHFPMTASRKIDRRALIQEYLDQHRSRAIVSPRNSIEENLVQIWKEIFGIAPISVYDNFFALGGNSLISIEFCSRLKNAYQLEYRSEYLVMKPTVAQIAEDIFIQREQPCQVDHIHRAPLKVSILPLREYTSSEQKSLIFLSGGAMSEKEIVLAAQLLPYLSSEHSVYAVHLNLWNENCVIPSSIDDISSLIVQQILNLNLTQPPILVGECISCVLTTHVAKKLSERLNVYVDVLLLNPWHPRGVVIADAQHPMTSTTYFLNLLKNSIPQRYLGGVILFLPQEQVLTNQDYIKWWTEIHGLECQLKRVPGNISSYIRMYRSDLAALINLYISNIHCTIALTD